MTRLGYFLVFFVTNFLTKVAQIFGYFIGLFKILSLSCKNDLATFCGKIG